MSYLMSQVCVCVFFWGGGTYLQSEALCLTGTSEGSRAPDAGRGRAVWKRGFMFCWFAGPLLQKVHLLPPEETTAWGPRLGAFCLGSACNRLFYQILQLTCLSLRSQSSYVEPLHGAGCWGWR